MPLHHNILITTILRLLVDYMIVSCSACQTRFNVNVSALSGLGRKVRCSNCGKIWHQMPFEESNPPTLQMVEGGNISVSYDQIQEISEENTTDYQGIEAAQQPEIDISSQTISQPEIGTSVFNKAIDESQAENAGSGWAGSLLLILVLLGLFVGGYLYHIEIVEFWPSTRLFFEMVGLGTDR